ncbi:MAG: hypothetical protein FAZ92_03777 [Accumulibacter sp.]|nr:MAG: hypothetical protein FAZ92_03777 [Accumulibacter sp.]
MTREKVAVPLEAAVAMASAMQSETQAFVAEAGEKAIALAGSVAALTGSRSGEDFSDRQAAFGEALRASALCWYQLWGRAAEVVEQGMRPVLRQVEDNAGRLGTR